MHGFDEYFGSLYHLNASEEPEKISITRKTQNSSKSSVRVAYCAQRPRARAGRVHRGYWTSNQEADGNNRRGNLAAAKDFITRQKTAGKPFFCWWNAARMHFRTHVKAANRSISGQDEYSDGMVEHDAMVGEMLKLVDDLGIASDTIVSYSTDNGPHYNAWPDTGTTPFRGEKNSNWEGAYRVPAFVRWPGRFPAGATLNGLVAHED